MNYLPLILSVTLLNILGAISPGPDFIIVVRNSLKYSRKIGIYTGFGIGIGIAMHVTFWSLGIAFLISKSILLFSIMKYIGVLYLIYLGIMSIKAKKTEIEISENKELLTIHKVQAVKVGFMTNILNSKATLFFLGLFTMVVSHTTPWFIILIIAMIIVATAITWFSLVSTFFSQKKIKEAYYRFEKKINIVFGILLILLALKFAIM